MADLNKFGVSIDDELLQSFVRVNVVETDDTPKTESVSHVDENESSNEKGILGSKKKKKKSKKVVIVEKSGTIKNKCLVKRRERIRGEELYTDKDRAAAVNMGNKDIKQSLKIKRKEERSKAFLLPDEADPAQLLALGHYEMNRKDLVIALSFINKALELNPVEKNALVARSKCQILLGQPEEGLKDAEAALTIDKTFLKAIYQKAESLYYLGDFEHSLMYFHRGLHIRPDHEGFKTGVEKAQKAIENALGIGFNKKSIGSRSGTPGSRAVSSIGNKSNGTGGKSASYSTKMNKSNRLLRELAIDKEYLDELLNNPDIKCKHKDNDDQVIGYIEDAVDYLNKCQEFWRQQLPPKKMKNQSNIN